MNRHTVHLRLRIRVPIQIRKRLDLSIKEHAPGLALSVGFQAVHLEGVGNRFGRPTDMVRAAYVSISKAGGLEHWTFGNLDGAVTPDREEKVPGRSGPI
jgi:hypothetical protein